MKILVDAMGGDNAPGEIVKGAVEAVQAENDIKVFLVGRQDAVNAELEKYTYDKEKIEVVHAEEVIEMAEPPVNAIRKKKQSSLVIGMNMIKHQEADAKKHQHGTHQGRPSDGDCRIQQLSDQHNNSSDKTGC